jgi:hypothetical protein
MNTGNVLENNSEHTLSMTQCMGNILDVNQRPKTFHRNRRYIECQPTSTRFIGLDGARRQACPFGKQSTT